MNIKSPREIALMKEAGRINFIVHKEMEKYIKPGITTKELDEKIGSLVKELGGYPSCLGYEGFPNNACVSVNEEVVHGIGNHRKLKNGDIVKLDFTVRQKGYESDMTRTYIVGETTEEVKKFVKVCEESMYEGIKQVKPGARIGDIGYAISKCAHDNGYSVIEDYVGHGIGTEMHEDPEVPNFGEKGTGIVLKEGMVIAIEPMLAMGQKEVKVLKNGWTAVTKDNSLSAHFEHTVAVTKDGYEILTGE